MQQNFLNTYQQQPFAYPQTSPNAVSINIFAPQAYGNTHSATLPVANNGFYSLYGQNMNPNLPMYPQNYNNLALQQNLYGNSNNTKYPQTQQMPVTMMDTPKENPNALNKGSKLNTTETNNLAEKTPNSELDETEDKKTKKITPLTDEYIKSIENYLNSDNRKMRLIGAKEVLERFKEDENRKDNPSLMALLNKCLRDVSPAVRFVGLSALQLGYALGNDETVTILKEIQSKNGDQVGEDQLMASEILLKMSASEQVEVPMTQNEIKKAQKEKEKSKKKDK